MTDQNAYSSSRWVLGENLTLEFSRGMRDRDSPLVPRAD